jgi:formylglycine-generating enzyme required for sulfatase activity
MVANKVPVETSNGKFVNRPNFDRVPETKLAEFKTRVQTRFPSDDFARDWEALVAMSTGILDAIFDDGARGLKGIEFRNKSLQEFLCAWYLAKHCGRGKPDLSKPGESLVPKNCNAFLWDWIYLPFDELSHDYQDIWTYLTQMREDAIDPDIWLESIAPLYYQARQSSDPQTKKTVWIAKRSSEMIFRSWLRLNHHCDQCHPRALTIREDWWNEFEQEILSEKRGADLQGLAKAVQDDLLELPGGTFTMGSPPGSVGKLDENHERFYQRIIDGAPREPDQLPAYISLELQSDHWTFSFGRAGETQRAAWQTFLINVCSGGGIPMVERAFAGRTYEHWHEVAVEKFQLGRSPCLNEWYRLFDPGHGIQPVIRADYEKYSLISQQPVIYVQWFDAWAFCQWARWEGQSCHLPSEAQWEYAAKFGVDPAWEYWWKGDFEPRYCNARWEVGTTTKPDPSHANPATKERKVDPIGKGIMDILGNVNEWCSDVYETRHSGNRVEELHDVQSSRCLRGGSFGSLATDCRCAIRGGDLPFNAYRVNGFRVARA